MSRSLFLAAILAIFCLSTANAIIVTVGWNDPRIVFSDGFDMNYSSRSCGKVARTHFEGSIAAFNFTGTEVNIIGSADAAGGVYEVYIDGELRDTVDRYTSIANDTCIRAISSIKRLSCGEHHLEVVFRGSSGLAWPFGGIMDIMEIQYTVPDSNSTGPIVGIVIGGISVLIVIAVFGWLIIRKKSAKQTQVDPLASEEKGYHSSHDNMSFDPIAFKAAHGSLPSYPHPLAIKLDDKSSKLVGGGVNTWVISLHSTTDHTSQPVVPLSTGPSDDDKSSMRSSN